MRETDEGTWSQALDGQFTDQAHFIRDFKAFTDRTPGEFAREMRSIQAFFRDRENVVFLQAPSADRR